MGVAAMAYAGDTLGISVRLGDGTVLRVKQPLPTAAEPRQCNPAQQCGSAGGRGLHAASGMTTDVPAPRHDQARFWLLAVPAGWLLLLLADR